MEEIEDYGTGIALTQQEISELVEQYEKYKLVHRPFNKYHIKQMQTQSLQYHPFCISSGKQLVPC